MKTNTTYSIDAQQAIDKDGLFKDGQYAKHNSLMEKLTLTIYTISILPVLLMLKSRSTTRLAHANFLKSAIYVTPLKPINDNKKGRALLYSTDTELDATKLISF